MTRPRQTEKTGAADDGRKLPRRSVRASRLSAFPVVAAFALLLVAGCKHENRASGNNSDPLLGPPVPAPVPQASAPAQNPAPATAAIPTGSSSPTLAGLAAGSTNAAGGNMRISDSNHTASATATPAAWQAPAAGGAVTLRGPEAATGPPPVAGSAPVAATPVSSSRVESLEQAQVQLAQRKVTWWHLEALGDRGEYKFTCSAPSPQNPRKSRTYEAKARDSLAAVRAVLDQIDRGR